MHRKSNKLSKTPRHHGHSRKIPFSLAMREKMSKSWVAIREELKKPKKKRKR